MPPSSNEMAALTVISPGAPQDHHGSLAATMFVLLLLLPLLLQPTKTEVLMMGNMCKELPENLLEGSRINDV